MPRAAAKKKVPAWPGDPLPDDAVLLTLDASSTAIGWACFVGTVIRAADVISCPKSWPASKRMRHNAWTAAELIEEYSITHICAESQSHKSAGPRVQGLATLGKAQGYLFAVIEERRPDLLIQEVDERTWTCWAARNRPKSYREKIIKGLIPQYAEAIDVNKRADLGLDVCDAIGIALARLGVVK